MPYVTKTDVQAGAWRSNGDRLATEAQLKALFGKGWFLEYDYLRCKDVLIVDWRHYTGVFDTVVVDFGVARVALRQPVPVHPGVIASTTNSINSINSINTSSTTNSINTSSTTNSSKKLLLL